MPKLLYSMPKYRRHSSRNVAFVVLSGQRIYLPGKYGSDKSRREYRRLINEWDVNGREPGPIPDSVGDITIAELLIRYWRFEERVEHGFHPDRVSR